jgi:hypothetical protein
MMTLAGDHVQVLVGGYELTGDYNRINVSDTYDQHDVTAFGDAVHKFINGQRTIALDHAGYMNRNAARSHPVLSGAAVEGVLSFILGQNTNPAVGDPMHSLLGIQGKYSVLPEINQVIPFGAVFANKGDEGGWGVTLTPPVSFTNSASGAAVDNGAATSSGGVGVLHVLQQSASDTYSIIVEGATDAAFTTGVVTLATFGLNASALGSDQKIVTGSIPRYVRWRATRTGAAGNTVRIAVGFMRL